MSLPLPLHPEPWAFKWSELEAKTIKEYGQAYATAERDRFAELCDAAQAVITRWDSPAWKDQPHTAEYIKRLRAALEDLK